MPSHRGIENKKLQGTFKDDDDDIPVLFRIRECWKKKSGQTDSVTIITQQYRGPTWLPFSKTTNSEILVEPRKRRSIRIVSRRKERKTIHATSMLRLSMSYCGVDFIEDYEYDKTFEEAA